MTVIDSVIDFYLIMLNFVNLCVILQAMKTFNVEFTINTFGNMMNVQVVLV